ncbi:MAG TPA: hypothetical protein VII76_03865 [Acidimicrobiales bacterium]
MTPSEAALALLTIHHGIDVVGALEEMARVARRAAVLSFDPVGHDECWLFTQYVPEATALAWCRVLPLTRWPRSSGRSSSNAS